MVRKTAVAFITLLVLVAFAPALHAEKLKDYTNTKYGYSLKYPAKWFIAYLGRTEADAAVVRFAFEEGDTEFAEGSEIGLVIEIIVSDIAELKGMGARFPPIKTPEDWLKWERSNRDKEEADHIGPFVDEGVTVGGLAGIKTTYKKPIFKGAGPAIELVLYNPAKDIIISIKYLGKNPEYEKNLKVFEDLLKSLKIGS